MRIACVNQDRGIGPKSAKGAAVHLSAMRAAFERCGASVLALDEPDDERLRVTLSRELELGRIDMVYERYALGKHTALGLCERFLVPHILEVNAPLIEEAQRYRGHLPTEHDTEAERHLFQGSDHILCVARATRDHVVRVRGNDRGVSVEPNAVEPLFTRDADPRFDFIEEGPIVIGFHGRVRPWHGFERTVALVKALLARGRDVRLGIVGAGEFDLLCEPLPPSKVARSGWVPSAQIPGFVARFDLVVLPYGADAPPWFSPLKLAEAMSQGAVPIASDVGDLSCMIEHGNTGFVVAAGDQQALLEASQCLLDDAPLRKRMSAAAKIRGRQRTWDDVAANVLRIAANSKGPMSGSARDLH